MNTATEEMNKYSMRTYVDPVELTKLRYQLDGLSKLEQVDAKTKQSLLLAKAWLGVYKGMATEQDSPYKNDGKRHSVNDIEPTADAVEGYSTKLVELRFTNLFGQEEVQYQFGSPSYLTDIEVLDITRQLLQKLIDGLQRFQGNSREESIALTQIYVHAKEAKMKIGFHLGELREVELKKKATILLPANSNVEVVTEEPSNDDTV